MTRYRKSLSILTVAVAAFASAATSAPPQWLLEGYAQSQTWPLDSARPKAKFLVRIEATPESFPDDARELSGVIVDVGFFSGRGALRVEIEREPGAGVFQTVTTQTTLTTPLFTVADLKGLPMTCPPMGKCMKTIPVSVELVEGAFSELYIAARAVIASTREEDPPPEATLDITIETLEP
jgi:hypothetical protein